MSQAKSISLTFPAWNEENYIELAVARATKVLRKLTDDYEIVIVNDASTDRTGAIADQLARDDKHIKVIHHPQNLKLGGALRTGFGAATKDIVVYSDIDLPFDLSLIERALYYMDYLEADMICGYRLDRTSEGFKRIAYSFGYNALVRSAFGVSTKDINFSFKVMRREVLEAIDLKSTGSFIDVELVVKAIKLGYRYFQFGVDYFPRTRGESTLASPSVIFKMLREMTRLYRETKAPARKIPAASSNVLPLRSAPRPQAING